MEILVRIGVFLYRLPTRESTNHSLIFSNVTKDTTGTYIEGSRRKHYGHYSLKQGGKTNGKHHLSIRNSLIAVLD